jgi:DNA-binding LacI/PurR family transcriptional regulator
MTDATRARILAAAKELGWQRDWRGAALARRRSQVIGLLSGTAHVMLGGVYAELVSTLVERLAEHDHNLLILPATGQRWRDQLTDGRVDGAFVVQPLPDGLDDFHATHPVPLVLINLPVDLPLDQVLVDEQKLIALLLEKMRNLGVSRPAYVYVRWPNPEHFPAHPSEHERRTAHAWSAICDTTPWELANSLPQLSPTIDSFVAYSEGDAALIQQVLRQRGTPATVGCITGSSLPVFIDPQPVTVELPVAQLATRAVDLLLARIADGQRPTITERLA